MRCCFCCSRHDYLMPLTGRAACVAAVARLTHRLINWPAPSSALAPALPSLCPEIYLTFRSRCRCSQWPSASASTSAAASTSSAAATCLFLFEAFARSRAAAIADKMFVAIAVASLVIVIAAAAVLHLRLICERSNLALGASQRSASWRASFANISQIKHPQIFL